MASQEAFGPLYCMQRPPPGGCGARSAIIVASSSATLVEGAFVPAPGSAQRCQDIYASCRVLEERGLQAPFRVRGEVYNPIAAPSGPLSSVSRLRGRNSRRPTL